ncbi:hypothetical protein ES703_41052 [subsurface metagenome]
MRSVNNQRAAVGEYGLKFVHNLARYPEVVVHLWRDTENDVVRLVFVYDMHLLGQVRSFFPGFSHIPDKDSLKLILKCHYGK